MKTKSLYFLCFALISAMLLFVWITLAKVVPTRNPIIPPNLDDVPIKMYGVVEPAGRAVFISPPRQKRVDAILVNVGDTIKKGQPLVVLDNAQEKIHVDVTKAEVEARQAELDQSEDKWKRNQPLFAQQVINEFDFIQSELEVNIKKALLEVAQANLRDAQTRLDELTLTSPVDGKVYRLDIRLGETFNPGDRTFIVGDKALWVNLRVDSFWIHRVKRGKYTIYHADTNQHLGDGELIRTNLFMGPPNFYIEDPTVMVELKYLEAFVTFNSFVENVPIELVVYAEKAKD